MSAPLGTLQIVPDIDDEKKEKKPTIVVKPPHIQSSSAKKLTSSEVKLSTAALQSQSPRGESPQVLMMSPRVAMVRRRGHSALTPPIQQMSSDAQPLTSAELLAHRQLLRVQRLDEGPWSVANRNTSPSHTNT